MSSSAPTTSTPRLADRLAAARRGQFVGRQSEIAVFQTALLADESPYVALHIFGPGGVGKSTLLREFARLASEAGRPVITLDGRNLEPSPQGVFGALGGVDEWSEAGVWLFDTYELFEPLDRWLRETFLPQLPARSLVVFAGRNRPATAWRTDLDWGLLTRIVELGNLYPAESSAYLTARGIAAPLHAHALDVSRGHPLALALVADVLGRGESLTATASTDLLSAPDVVRILLERFVSQTPSPDHRRALEMASLVWTTTETLLADVVSADRAHDLFAWLRDLSFVQQGPYGLFPHDLAREVLETDLRWRDPGGYQELIAALFRHYFAALQQASRLEQQRIWLDLFSLLRRHSYFGQYFDWSAFGTSFAVPAAPEHAEAIISMVRQHEGDASADIVAHWLSRQPAAFWVFRNLTDSDDVIFGFMAQLHIQDATPDDLARDPAIAPALTVAREAGPLPPDAEVLHLRFWMDAEQYQVISPALNLVAINCSIHWTSRPNLAWNFVTIADPDFHQDHFTGVGLFRAHRAEFVVGDTPYAIFAHDWLVQPAAAWLESKYHTTPETLATDTEPAPSTILTRPDFDAAVRQALRDFTRADLLATNPLTQTHLVLDAQPPAPGQYLQSLIRDAVAPLSTNPKDRKLHRALWHTYLEPAPTQEQAAELLDLPFNTYRYHLTKGIERLTASLWEQAT